MFRHPAERWSRLGISRREFLRRSATTGLALPSAAAILAACARRQEPGVGGVVTPGAEETPQVLVGTPDNPATQPIFDDNPPIESGLQQEPGPLRIYNWADYLRPRTMREFGEQFGVEVELTTFYNEEEAIRKLRTGELKVDVYFPTSEIISKLVAGKIMQPLNHDYIPNLQANVWPFLANPFYDQGSQYTVPYTVYQTGIGYRTDMVDPADVEPLPNPWDVFWNTDYAGITGLYDDFEETIAVAMFHNGVADPIVASADEIAAAADALVEAVNAMNLRFTIDGAYAKLPEGKFGLHHAWSGDMVATPYYYPKGDDPATARYLWPPKAANSSTGGYIANDTLSVVRGAEHPVLAHLFLNYMLEEQAALENFGWVGYQPPQTGLDPDSLVADGWVAEWLESAIVRQEDFEHVRGVIPRQLTPEQEAQWLEAWSRVQAG